MKSKRWTWWETLLWAYSTLYIIFVLGVYIHYSYVPFVDRSVSTSANTVAIFMVLPIFIFLVLEGVRHLKHDSEKE